MIEAQFRASLTCYFFRYWKSHEKLLAPLFDIMLDMSKVKNKFMSRHEDSLEDMNIEADSWWDEWYFANLSVCYNR